MHVRFGPLCVPSRRDPETGRARPAPPTHLWAAEATELDAPEGCERVRWVLLCTEELERVEHALELALGAYGLRWGIERFHHCWKQVLGAQRTFARSEQSLRSWMHITAGAAVEIEEMMTLSREQPELLALEAMERPLLEAIVAATPAKAAKGARLEEVTLERAVAWLATIGGYIERPSQGPPGHITIGRGLERIEALVRLLDAGAIERKT